MRSKTIVAFILLVILQIACKEAADVYIGIPLQPKFEENNYEAGLNIFGVLRPDFSDTINNSFVHVQEVAPAIGNYPEFTNDSLIIEEAQVYISDSLNSVFDFTYTTHNKTFKDINYRPDSSFKPIVGGEYTLTTSAKDLPIINSTTTIPNQPILIKNSITISNNSLYFEVLADTTTFLYDIYTYSSEEYSGFSRVVSNLTDNTAIVVELSTNNIDRIEIYAYDYNLANYYLVSNTSLNFNKYRKTFGNIENGYGVFGSINYLTVPL